MTRQLQSRTSQQAFSLVEVLIGLGVLSIVLIGVASATITSSRMLYRIMADADINQEIRYVEGQLARDVRAATGVTIDADGKLSIRTSTGIIDYFTKTENDGEVILIREDQVGKTKHTILQDISDVTFSVPAYSVTVVEMEVKAFIKVATTQDVERTYFSRFTSRVSRL